MCARMMDHQRLSIWHNEVIPDPVSAKAAIGIAKTVNGSRPMLRRCRQACARLLVETGDGARRGGSGDATWHPEGQ
jgi:hypothetical protein